MKRQTLREVRVLLRKLRLRMGTLNLDVDRVFVSTDIIRLSP
ncbi:hypothetical protein [Chamaesiphon sp.]